jgi:hypothetical protein
MDNERWTLLNALLLLLVALLQFLLRRSPQSAKVLELERRLEEAEQ